MRTKLAKKPQDDRALDARISQLYRSLSDLADRHAEFVEGLKPIAPAAWTQDQII